MNRKGKPMTKIFHRFLAVFLFAAVWSMPVCASSLPSGEDDVELDLSKGDIVITAKGYIQGEEEEVTHRGSYTIMSSKKDSVPYTITVQSDMTALTLRDLKIASEEVPLSIVPGGENTMVKLSLAGTNILQSVEGDHAGIAVPEGAFLEIQEGSGTLSVTGSGTGAGIGGTGVWKVSQGNTIKNCGNVTILGGDITVTGGSGGGSGIGGAKDGVGGDIEIGGGHVVITGGEGGTGIGSSKELLKEAEGGTIQISGGVVNVTNGIGTSNDTLTGIGDGNPWVVADKIEAKIGSFSGVLFQGDEGKLLGGNAYKIEENRTLPAKKTLTIESGMTLEISEEACLTLEGTLKNDGSLKLGSEESLKKKDSGSLEGNGKFTVPGFTPSMIYVPFDLVYDGSDEEMIDGDVVEYTAEDIGEKILEKIGFYKNRNGEKEIFGKIFTITPDISGWNTKTLDEPVTRPGEYIVTFSKNGEGSVKKKFMVYDTGDGSSLRLDSIYVFQKPLKMTYQYKEDFDDTDMVVVGTYEDGSVRNVTELVHVEWSALELGTHSVKVIYDSTNIGDRDEVSCTLDGVNIIPKEFDVSGLSWSTDTIIYDGTEKEIDLKGKLPKNIAVECNGYKASDAGTYTAVARFYLEDRLDEKYYKIVGPNPLITQWTIQPMELTIKTEDLMALGQAGDSFQRSVSLYGTLTASGVLPKDADETETEWPAESLIGTYDGTESGQQEITLAWKDGKAPNPGNNYVLPEELPVVIGNINNVKAIATPLNLPEDGREYRQEMEVGISSVPRSLQGDGKLGLPKGIETRMRSAITEQERNILITNTAVYDVSLLVKQEDYTWAEAEDSVFPEEGLIVTLPYPSNTGQDTHEFIVAHMYTEGEEHEPGEIEYPEVTNTSSGIQFKVKSLSPISVGWKNIEKSGEANVTGAATNDEAAVGLYLILAMVSTGGILFFMRKVLWKK